MHPNEKKLFDFIKANALQTLKELEGSDAEDFSADILLMITTIEKLKTDTFRTALLQYVTLALKNATNFFAISRVVYDILSKGPEK
jgi:hypothetical protein